MPRKKTPRSPSRETLQNYSTYTTTLMQTPKNVAWVKDYMARCAAKNAIAAARRKKEQEAAK